jgi:cysteine desulfurase
MRALGEFWHNPSSVHRGGQAARQQVELARRDVAELIGAKPREITFTSGGTESIDLALRGSAESRAAAASILVTTRIEHAAVRDLAESMEKGGIGGTGGAEVRWAPVDRSGTVVLDRLEPLLQGARLCSIQWVNNETGVIQPIEQIAALCRGAEGGGVRFHCDGTQYVGKLPVTGLPFDLLTFSPHKFHGPKGVGILWARRGISIHPALHGTQESGRRGGTENVPGILGAGVACREAREWLEDAAARERLGQLRDQFEQTILRAIPDSVVNGGGGASRIWNTSNIGFPRIEAEALLLMLSERGVFASAGAACSSGSLDPSPVLLAMGIAPEVAHGSLRFSLSRYTTAAEIDEAAGIVIECVLRLRSSLSITA